MKLESVSTSAMKTSLFMKSNSLILLFALLFSCSSAERSSLVDSADVRSIIKRKVEDALVIKVNFGLIKFESYPELNLIINRPKKCKGGFWKVILVNDSTTKIQFDYHDKKIVSVHEFGLWESRHFQFIDENENFLILRTHTGSDWQNDLLIPLNKNVQEYYFENTMAFDSPGQYVAVVGQGNVLFEIVNLINGSRQSVLNTWKSCEAVSNKNCVKNVYFSNGQLVWEQYSPHNFDKNKEYSEQKVLVKI